MFQRCKKCKMFIIPVLLCLHEVPVHPHEKPLFFFSLSIRGCFKNAQWTGQEQLHGAELPRPEPHPQHPGAPGSGRSGRTQRRAYGARAGALGGRSSGRGVVSCGRVFSGPQWLSGHADLQGNDMELSQPGPKVPAGLTQNQRTNQVAAFTALKNPPFFIP